MRKIIANERLDASLVLANDKVNYELADHCVTLKKSGQLSRVESLLSMRYNQQLSTTTEAALKHLPRSISGEIFDRVSDLGLESMLRKILRLSRERSQRISSTSYVISRNVIEIKKRWHGHRIPTSISPRPLWISVGKSERSFSKNHVAWNSRHRAIFSAIFMATIKIWFVSRNPSGAPHLCWHRLRLFSSVTTSIAEFMDSR